MSRDEDIRKFMHIMAKLETPASALSIGISIYKPEKMPLTLDEIIELEKQGMEPSFSMSRYSHSVTRNYYNVMMMMGAAMNPTHTTGFQDGNINVKSVAGAIVSETALCPIPDALEAYTTKIYGNTTERGIRIGTGTTPESFNDFCLDTKIEHGDGGGQIRYFDQYYPIRNWDNIGRKWTTPNRRYFSNQSGGTIIVGETGLFYRIRYKTTGEKLNIIMMARDVLSPAIAVEHCDLFMVEYISESVVWPS